ncbi:TlpA family protein disulfide reductase [Propioniciclava sinopodophylli]|uniref:TlpA family protein disulfide reductase n=1 Tax=Propioniciclava sinopodophylli TaxID=1837344 RepID=UPI0013F16294|nr:TlpA disulfide reductase family protein [Propioniciclava sinopodophylli]
MRGVGSSAGAAAASLALLLAGCTAGAPSSEPAPDRRVEPALVAQREAAGIPDCPETPASATAVEGGLPDLLLGCLGSGRQVNLAALRGKPMIINFWAQWCAPCRLEAPHLKEFAARAGDDVLVLGVDFADPDPALALEFASEAGWTYPHLTDPLKQTAGPVRFQGIPITLYVDAEGVIAYRAIGGIASTEQMVKDADTFLGVRL